MMWSIRLTSSFECSIMEFQLQYGVRYAIIK